MQQNNSLLPTIHVSSLYSDSKCPLGVKWFYHPITKKIMVICYQCYRIVGGEKEIGNLYRVGEGNTKIGCCGSCAFQWSKASTDIFSLLFQ